MYTIFKVNCICTELFRKYFSLLTSTNTARLPEKHSNIHVCDVCKFVESNHLICVPENFGFAIMHNNALQFLKASPNLVKNK